MNLVEDYAEIFGILLYLLIESAIYLRKEKCRRHWISVASYAETPLGVSNQRSLFAKRGKVNGWLLKSNAYGISPFSNRWLIQFKDIIVC